MENDKEIDDLKTLYDELLHNGKRLVKDMRKSVDLYLTSALLTLIFAGLSVIGLAPYLELVRLGIASTLTWVVVIIEVIVTSMILGFGLLLLRLYARLKARYKKIFEMEKNWSKTDG